LITKQLIKKHCAALKKLSLPANAFKTIPSMTHYQPANKKLYGYHAPILQPGKGGKKEENMPKK